MIDHLSISPTDIEKARQFYIAALEPLGLKVVMEITANQTGDYHGIGYGAAKKPVFWLSAHSDDKLTPSCGRRQIHIAFAAETRTAVDAFYRAAIANGGRDNGSPGIRSHYHPAYYAAFVLDPDGVNVEAVCHSDA